MSRLLDVLEVLGAESLFARRDPAFEPREPQLRFAQAVQYVIGRPRGGIVLGHLPTGSGKGRGALVAPVLAGCDITYATNTKGLQRQLADHDIPYLNDHLQDVLGRPVRSAVVLGRDNYLCLHKLDELAAGPGGVAFATPEAHREWLALEPWVRTTTDGVLDAAPVPPGPELRGRLTVDEEHCDHRQCPFFDRCFVEQARAAAGVPGTIIVANHHLVLLDAELRRRTAGRAAVLPRRPHVLIWDEAHAGQDAGRDVLGARIHFGYGRSIFYRLRRLAAETGVGEDAEDLALVLQDALDAWATDLTPRVRAAARRTGRAELLLGDERARANAAYVAAEAVANICRDAARELERAAARATLDDDAERAAGLAAGARRWLRQGDAAERFAGVVQLIATPPEAGGPDGDGDAFLRQARLEGETTRQQRLVASWTPVDVSKPFTSLLWDGSYAPVVVACSATLATAPTGPARLAYFRQEAGVPASTPERPVLELVEDSPFDWRRNARLYVAPPAAIPADRRRDREAFDAQLAAEVARVLRTTTGRGLVLFSSVQSRDAAAELVPPQLPGHWRLFCQGAAPRSAILEAFSAPGRPPVVCFATRGWWEGTDIPGLDAVVVDRLPFSPPDDPLHAARCRQVERASGDRWAGWERVSFPEMVLHLAQGVGRLLRSRRDRGVVFLLDSRIRTKGYGRKVLAALPPMPLTESLADVEAFFRSTR